MTIKPINEIKTHFSTGEMPDGSDFQNLIDSAYNKSDGDGTHFLADDGLYKTIVTLDPNGSHNGQILTSTGSTTVWTTPATAFSVASIIPEGTTGYIVTNVDGISTWSAPVTSYAVSAVIDLQSILDSKQVSGDYSLNGHGHSVADVTELQTLLDSKQVSGNYAGEIHSHSVSAVTELQNLLDSKQASGDYLTSHAVSSVNSQTGDVLITAASISAAPEVHDHEISSITNLQSTLDTKTTSGDFKTINGESILGAGNIGTGAVITLPEISAGNFLRDDGIFTSVAFPTRTVYAVSATSNQTVFTCAHSNLSNVDLWLNGYKLWREEEYISSDSGTTVTLISPATEGTRVEIIVLE